MSEYYSNFIFHCAEFLKSTGSYLRGTSVKQLGDQFEKCHSRPQFSKGFSMWNLALDSPQFPLNCKTACYVKGEEPCNWDLNTELRKDIQNILRKQSCTGRERCKELFSLAETVLLYIVLDFNSVCYSRHDRSLAKLGTSWYEERYRVPHLLLGFEKICNLNGYYNSLCYSRNFGRCLEMGKIIHQTLCLLLRSVLEFMPVIKISLPHLYFRLIYSFGDGIFLKFKLHFPEEFPHAFQKLMICSCLDWYKYLCIYIFTYVQINVTVHNTN